MAVWVCYDIAKKNLRYNIVMIILATAEIYGGAPRDTLVPSRDSKDCLLTLDRIHHLLPRVARRQHQPRHEQLHVQVDVPGLLQHAVGVDSALRYLCRVRRYLERLQGQGGGYGDEEEQIRVAESVLAQVSARFRVGELTATSSHGAVIFRCWISCLHFSDTQGAS
jgi:hypothetical protein